MLHAPPFFPLKQQTPRDPLYSQWGLLGTIGVSNLLIIFIVPGTGTAYGNVDLASHSKS